MPIALIGPRFSLFDLVTDMTNDEQSEKKQTSILRKIVDQQNVNIAHMKMNIIQYKINICDLENEIENYKIILRKLYPEKEMLENRIKYLDQSIEDLNLHLSETLKSRERLQSSISWRSTAWLRWLGRRL